MFAIPRAIWRRNERERQNVISQAEAEKLMVDIIDNRLWPIPPPSTRQSLIKRPRMDVDYHRYDSDSDSEKVEWSGDEESYALAFEAACR